ncbi:peptidase domain-containing ABC transporter [Bradyrhizobium sp. CCBAU 53421]|uniref:peptidase domain-containing ABC transporter n=1 Tax=Bradyrhizobium sp. CCBAU 53421 TaxID=1325120 RepID=UPI00188C1CEF|nr:peptidase domain-containing ABC transporter [Bradyrhizobium sp. CCBAU 53421]QOZ31653.1 peptidase C39 [Bradyrhizobium sp. CCBAU 53421]
MSCQTTKLKQRDMMDCGAVSLASVAAHYGCKLPLSRIRQYASTDQSGTTVSGLLNAAQKLGFIAKGVRGDFNSLHKIPKPAIAHVIVKEVLHHFVVIQAVDVRRVTVMDPAFGEIRRLSHEEFKRQWTGVMVLLVPSDTFKRRDETTSTLVRFAKLLAPHKVALAQALVGALVTTILGLSTPIYVQKTVDHVITSGDRNLLNVMTFVMLLILVPQILISLLRSRLILQTGQKIDASLIGNYYTHILRLSQNFFDSMRVGELVSRMNDAVKIRSFLNQTCITMFVNILVILFSFGLMLLYSWKITVVAAISIPLYALIYWTTNRLNSKRNRATMENAADLQAQLVESIGAVSTIKTFGMEKSARLKMENRLANTLQSVYSAALISIIGDNASTFVSSLFTILLMWCGTRLVLDQTVTPGELLSCYSLFAFIARPVASLIQVNRSVQDAVIAADRLFEIFDLEPARDGSADATNVTPGDICLENVTFRYGAQPNLFQGLSVTFRRGAMTAVVGESGSGKSSLAALLQNVYPLEGGCIRIGSHDLKDFSAVSLRKLVGVVPQSTDVFLGSVIENIALGELEPELESIIKVCDQTGLREAIEHWPGGFKANLGESGVKLSGGEKQLLSLARVLYRNPEILILDEPTASLDSIAEAAVHRLLENLLRAGKTIVVISHRLNTIRRADKIVLLERGRIVAEGRHTDLLTESAYARFWQSQTEESCS